MRSPKATSIDSYEHRFADRILSSIADAVAAAPAGGTVVVCPGTQTERVLVNKATPRV
jgi:hypothetical protein